MQEVVDFILMGIKAGYEILDNFSITVYGFTFTMWDFLCVMFVLSCAVPFVVAPRSSGGIPNLAFGRGNSERVNEDVNWVAPSQRSLVLNHNGEAHPNSFGKSHFNKGVNLSKK